MCDLPPALNFPSPESKMNDKLIVNVTLYGKHYQVRCDAKLERQWHDFVTRWVVGPKGGWCKHFLLFGWGDTVELAMDNLVARLQCLTKEEVEAWLISGYLIKSE